jgi:hypothetical protein
MNGKDEEIELLCGVTDCAPHIVAALSQLDIRINLKLIQFAV